MIIQHASLITLKKQKFGAHGFTLINDGLKLEIQVQIYPYTPIYISLNVQQQVDFDHSINKILV